MNPVVLVGHQHNCPLHGVNQVESGSAAYTFNGRPVARVGDRTATSGNICFEAETLGPLCGPSRHKAAPTPTAQAC